MASCPAISRARSRVNPSAPGFTREPAESRLGELLVSKTCRDKRPLPHGVEMRALVELSPQPLLRKKCVARRGLAIASVLAAVDVNGATERRDGFLGELAVGDLIEGQLLFGRDVADIDAVLVGP